MIRSVHWIVWRLLVWTLKDHRLFALCRILSGHLPETDPDVAVWRWLDRERRSLVSMLNDRRQQSETNSRQTVLLPS